MTPDTAAIRERLEKARGQQWIGHIQPDLRGLSSTIQDSERQRMEAAFIDLIAHAPADIAALLAENERLRLDVLAARIEGEQTERERCAKIAREWFDRMIRAGELPADQMRMVKAITAHIARAIEADHGE